MCINFKLNGKFDNESDFQLCKSQMKLYNSEINIYIDCLNNEKKKVINDYNEAVRKFNCLAEGTGICF